jgi:hypothetical protein
MGAPTALGAHSSCLSVTSTTFLVQQVMACHQPTDSWRLRLSVTASRRSVPIGEYCVLALPPAFRGFRSIWRRFRGTLPYGFAILPVIASVYYEYIVRLAKSEDAILIVLGCAIAHEVGHCCLAEWPFYGGNYAGRVGTQTGAPGIDGGPALHVSTVEDHSSRGAKANNPAGWTLNEPLIGHGCSAG